MTQVAPAVVLDACFAITFGKVARFDLVTGLVGHRVVIASRALTEVRRRPARAIEEAIRASTLVVEGVDLSDASEAAALADFDRRPAFRGRGEAEVLALARTRGYVVASDEVAVLRAARDEFGPARVLHSPALLKRAVAEERISVDDAEALLHRSDVARAVEDAVARLGITVRSWLLAP